MGEQQKSESRGSGKIPEEKAAEAKAKAKEAAEKAECVLTRSVHTLFFYLFP